MFLSALTVVFSLTAVFLVPIMVFRSTALGMILSVVAVALASLTSLPAVLVALGDRVLVTRGHKDPDRAAETRWARWTGVALRRPALTLAVGLAVLLALAAPALGMRLGTPGAQVFDPGHSSRDGYDLVTPGFGPGAAAHWSSTPPPQPLSGCSPRRAPILGSPPPRRPPLRPAPVGSRSGSPHRTGVDNQVQLLRAEPDANRSRHRRKDHYSCGVERPCFQRNDPRHIGRLFLLPTCS